MDVRICVCCPVLLYALCAFCVLPLFHFYLVRSTILLAGGRISYRLAIVWKNKKKKKKKKKKEEEKRERERERESLHAKLTRTGAWIV